MKGKYYVKYTVQCKKRGECRIRYSEQLHHLEWPLDLIRTIKVARLRLAQPLQRVGNNEIHRRIMNFRLKGRRTVGRPKFQWTDGVLDDLRKLGIGLVDIHQGYKVLKHSSMGSQSLYWTVALMMMSTF